VLRSNRNFRYRNHAARPQQRQAEDFNVFRFQVFPSGGTSKVSDVVTIRIPRMPGGFPNGFSWLRRVAVAAGVIAVTAASAASAAPCTFQSQGEGHVSAVIDAHSLRFADGREVRLAGIEPALAAMLAGRNVRLAGEDDTPDRNGRERAFVWLLPDERPWCSVNLWRKAWPSFHLPSATRRAPPC
jgi:hypothetical protein